MFGLMGGDGLLSFDRRRFSASWAEFFALDLARRASSALKATVSSFARGR